MSVVGWVYGIKTGVTANAYWDMYQQAWMDDRKITIEDADEMLLFGFKVGLIWAPEIAAVGGFSSVPLTGTLVIVGTGLGASYAIGGSRGAEEFADYITTPSRWAPTIQEQLVQPVRRYIEEELWGRQLRDPTVRWAKKEWKGIRDVLG